MTMKTVTIKNIYKESLVVNGDKKVRMNVCISTDSKEDVLWYEVDEKYEPYLCDDRCDGIVVSIFLTAMRFGYEVIKSNYPISEKLYYNLTYHVIPHFFDIGKKEGKNYPRLKIEAETTSEKYNGKAVVTGMSRGVDSFTTLYEYKDFELEDYRITHLCYHNIGAHHGNDTLTGKSKYTSRELFEGQLQKTKEFCEKYDYELVAVDSNLNSILSDIFGRWYFNRTHTYRNLGTAMILQKLYKRYYYSSAHSLSNLNKLSVETDSASYERWVIPYLCTESMEFYSTNQEWSRHEKVERIAKMAESYDYLHVCLVGIKNCGQCLKCMITLMELDAMGDGVLDRYKNSFDIENYKQNHRDKWFSQIYELKTGKIGGTTSFGGVFDCALEHNLPLLPEPEPELLYKEGSKLTTIKNNVNIRAFPNIKAKQIILVQEGTELDCIGKWERWFKIRMENGQTGYVFEGSVELTRNWGYDVLKK